MDIKKLAQSLHPYERRVLPELVRFPYVQDLAAKTGLKDVEVSRALQWLENKKAVIVKTELKDFIVLDKNGELYKKKGLPEKKFLSIVQEKELSLSKLAGKTGLARDEVNSCIGLLRQKGAILLLKEKELTVKITDKGTRMLSSPFPEELFLQKSFPCEVDSLSPEEKQVASELRKRKDIIRFDSEKIKKADITDIGKKLIAVGVRDENIIDVITPQILNSGEWKKKTLRRYDVTSPVPQIFAGKKQAYRAFLDWVRMKFISLGFREMQGPIVETDFWNMDALFMPQFHSARDIHDAYYIKEPKYGVVDESILKKVKAAHENGGDTGSSGWKYEFDVIRTKQQLLRTQGTACSAHMLSSKDIAVPGKYFGITRCFRHDVIDATHLPDFNQVEGMVIEEDLTFRHLVTLLKMFAKEFANAQEVRLVPGYFPFTEPSVELYAKHPVLGWVELGGAGMGRPEVVKPLLGKHMNVCLWGLGVDRLGMFNLGLKDIRNLSSQDLNVLRNNPVI